MADRPTAPDDIAEFLRAAIGSVWALDLLLFLHRREAEAWSPEQLTRELRSNPRLVADVLARLHAGGLVAEDEPGLFRYRPAGPGLADLVARVAQAHEERPFAVRRAVLAAPGERIQGLADAFRLKRG